MSTYGTGTYGSGTYGNLTVATGAPTVNITSGPDKTKLSRVAGMDASTFSFSVDESVQAWQVRLVPSSTSPVSAGTLIESGAPSGGSTGFATAILANAPHIYIKGDEASGSLLDSSGNNLHAFNVTVTSREVAAPSGWAGVGLGVDLNGTSDFFSIPYAASMFPGATGAFTIMLAVTVDAISTSLVRPVSWEDGTNGFSLGMSSTSGFVLRRTVAGTTAAAQTGSGTVSAGSTYLVHAIYTGSQLRVHLNGVQTGTTVSSSTSLVDPSTADFTVGKQANAATYSNIKVHEFAYFKSNQAANTQTHYDARNSGSSGGSGTGPFEIVLTDDELVAAGVGEGTSVVKVFAQDADGNWSL